MFYQYVDPRNTHSFAEVMKNFGYEPVLCSRTFLYVKKTLLGEVGQVYYPLNQVNIPTNLRFYEVFGLLEPLPNAQRTSSNVAIHVDLSAPSCLTSGLDKQRRWGVRKALQRGAEAYVAETKDDFNDFWTIYSATAKRRKSVVGSKSFLERAFREKNLSRLFIVEAKNQAIGAYFTLYSSDLARYLEGGFLTEFKDYHPNELGHYYALSYFQNRGLKIYDMGGAGTTPENAGFKKGWGRMITLYYCWFNRSIILAAAVKSHRRITVGMNRVRSTLKPRGMRASKS